MKKIILYLSITMQIISCSTPSGSSNENNGLNERFYPNKLLHTNLNEIDFNDKFIIIDFWATWCAPCIKGFTHFEKLASNPDFKDDAVFILLSDESEKKILKRLNNRTLKNVHFAVDQMDSIEGKTFQQFDVQYMPYTVVLSPTGETLWDGSTDELTSDKLGHLIAGTYKELANNEVASNKKENTVALDTIIGSNYSIITKPDFKDAPYGSTNKDQSGYSRISVSLGTLIKDLSGREKFSLVSSVPLDSTFYHVKFKCNPDSINRPFDFLLNKLLTHYNIHTESYTEQKEVLQLSILNNAILAKKATLQIEDGHGGVDYDKNKIVIINKPITILVNVLNELGFGPLILETGFDITKKYDFEINTKENLQGIKKQLQTQYGLSLTSITTPIEFLKIQKD